MTLVLSVPSRVIYFLIWPVRRAYADTNLIERLPPRVDQHV
jgi:hypothetical protein